MAFGFGFNKQKVLSAAEKFVQQGKLPNAIAEYEKILKADPKDLTVTNTVGDLYSRLGESEKAIDCFKSVGDAYATQGFTVKAIAMYKKLAKVKPSLESTLRLAELYTQQGLFNDARAQYLQVAEEFLRAGQLEQAVRIFQKTLEMDPDNVSMRMKLAEVYIRLNKKNEAWQIFSSAAEALRAKGALAQAEEILQRMLTLDPSNGYALLMRGRTQFDSGDFESAIESLERVADLDSHPDGLKILLQAYLQVGRLNDAGALATKLATVHNDTPAIMSYAASLVAGGQFEDALQVYVEYSDRLLSSDSDKVLESLHGMISHVRDNPAALETLIDLFNKAGEQTHLTEVYELLAHAYVQSGEFERSRDYYLKLTQLEPQNQLHTKNYQQVLAKLGTATESRFITAEEGSVLVDELEATAPFVDQRYPDETALAVRAALTDAELFISYNMPTKALGPLLSVLPKAPRDLRVNQRLAALHTRASRFPEAAVCCRTLESIYHDAGQPDEASRYGELAAKYEERASTAAPEETLPIEVQVHPTPVQYVAPVEPDQDAAGAGLWFQTPAAHAPVAHSSSPAAEPEEFAVPVAPPTSEIDLSQEWEEDVVVESPVAPPHQEVAAAPRPADPKVIRETIEEIRFYVANGMTDEAFACLAKLGQLGADHATLAKVQEEITAAAAAPAHEEAIHAPVVEEEPAEEVSVPPVVEVAYHAPAQEVAQPAQPEPDALGDFVSELESSFGEEAPAEAAPVQAAPPTPEPKLKPAAAPPPKPAPQPAEVAPAAAQADILGDFVSELEESLGSDFTPQAPAAPEKPKTQPWPVPAPQAEPKPAPVVAKAPPAKTPSAPATPVPPAAMAAAATASPSMETPVPSSHVRVVPPSAASGGSSFPAEAGIDLADMFGELKQELEEDTARADEDPETHYNLGVAFREMGLLDEAISEFQKVCQAVEHGHKFSQLIQTYTWLAQCFLDKGVPEAAIRWYEQALKLPDLDQESRVALHYELASSYETAHDRNSALNHFMVVYGNNIDYRDVADRIKALKS
jgi:tetratricopeptide (TPR) repeat protein